MRNIAINKRTTRRGKVKTLGLGRNDYALDSLGFASLYLGRNPSFHLDQWVFTILPRRVVIYYYREINSDNEDDIGAIMTELGLALYGRTIG